jgi:ATP-binding cassette subfamily F protein 3
VITGHHQTTDGYYVQTNTINLNHNFTIEEELMAQGCERQKARDIAGSMMFEGDNALKKISVLSGGEKSRVLLGKILVSPCNLLILDEPTNHLDMESCDSFMTAVDSFPGAAIIVTHNEMFLHGLANRFIVFQKDSVIIHEGSYQSFLDKIGWEEEEIQQVKKKTEAVINKKEARKLRSDINSRKSKELKPLENKIESIENEIIEREDKLEKIHNDLAQASADGESQKITDLSKQSHEEQKAIDSLYEKLDTITREFEKKNAVFEKELEELTGI